MHLPHSTPATTPLDDLDAAVGRLAATPDGPERQRLRDEVITALVPVACRIAGRFRGCGVGREDLNQIACLAMVKAVDRYRPERGRAFLAYALPCVTGELKRHLRDASWDVHVPRRAQEVCLKVRRAEAELEQRLGGRRPTAGELAAHTGLAEDEVQVAWRADPAFDALSLDVPLTAEGQPLSDCLGRPDPAMEKILDLVSLRPLIARLPERQRTILQLYYFDDLTQQQIAEKIGVSQMHISRLLRQACAFLRSGLLGEAPAKARVRAQPA